MTTAAVIGVVVFAGHLPEEGEVLLRALEGRAPALFFLGSLLVVHLQGVLTPAERQLVAPRLAAVTAGNGNGHGGQAERMKTA